MPNIRDRKTAVADHLALEANGGATGRVFDRVGLSECFAVQEGISGLVESVMLCC
jgi:hypothetical protein